MSIHEKALKGIFDDMDDLETKKMFPSVNADDTGKGFSVTITMNPDQSHNEEKIDEGADDDMDMEDLPADHDESLCKGGCVYHKGGVAMAQGGMIGEPAVGETDDLALPPFLRKKKNVTGK